MCGKINTVCFRSRKFESKNKGGKNKKEVPHTLTGLFIKQKEANQPITLWQINTLGENLLRFNLAPEYIQPYPALQSVPNKVAITMTTDVGPCTLTLQPTADGSGEARKVIAQFDRPQPVLCAQLTSTNDLLISSRPFKLLSDKERQPRCLRRCWKVGGS